MDVTPQTERLYSKFARSAGGDVDRLERVHGEIRHRLKADREKDQLRREQHTSNMLLTGVLATRAELRAFTERLDKYDTATVDALMHNDVKLQQSREELQRMLRQAHVLPDGRRVFRTEDGQRVFDEHGSEVSADVLAPSDIRHDSPSWERFSAERREEFRLEQERDGLLDFQQRADRARERIQGGDVTRQELDDLGADLDRNMPASVREALDRRNGSQPGSEQKDAPSKNGEKLDIEDPLRAQRAFDRSTPTAPAL